MLLFLSLPLSCPFLYFLRDWMTWIQSSVVLYIELHVICSYSYISCAINWYSWKSLCRTLNITIFCDCVLDYLTWYILLKVPLELWLFPSSFSWICMLLLFYDCLGFHVNSSLGDIIFTLFIYSLRAAFCPFRRHFHSIFFFPVWILNIVFL